MLKPDRLRPQDDPSSATGTGQPIGHVVSVRGSQATVGLLTSPLHEWDKVRSTVGKFLGIQTGESLLIGVITNVSIETPAMAKELGCHSTADLDLVGEIRQPAGVQEFTAHRSPGRWGQVLKPRTLHDVAPPAPGPRRAKCAVSRPDPSYQDIVTNDTPCRGSVNLILARPSWTFTVVGPSTAASSLARSSSAYCAGVGWAGDPIRCQAV